MAPNPLDTQVELDIDEQDRSVWQSLQVLRRRWISILVSSVIITALAIVVAVLLPPTYRSTATILIQEQEIPPELVRSTVTTFADERIQVISQEVLARSVLLKLIDKYHLYSNRRRFETDEEILDRMRKDIQLKPISADVTDRRTGNQVKATIAFSLSYESNSPDYAQKIANELTTLYLNENIKNREQTAAETSSFLKEEAARVAQHIADVDTKLAAFKEKNQEELPDVRELNQQLSEHTDSELLRVERDITEFTDRRSSLQSELALTSPYTALPSDSGEKVVLQPEDRLKSLKAQLAEMVGAYGDDYPDIKRLRREISSLEAQGVGSDQDNTSEERMTNLRATLTHLQEKYGDDYPDVARVRHELDALEKIPKPPTGEQPNGSDRVRADNPVYLNLRAQIDSANAQLQAYSQEKADLLQRRQELQSRLEKSPEVERQYLELARDQDNARARFRDLKQKQMEADVAQQLEYDRKAERFTLIDPPQYPERPASPNRLAIALVGFVLSLFGGASVGALRESLDTTIKGVPDLVRWLRVPTLSVIPLFEVDVRAERRTRLRWIIACGVVAIFLIALLMVHLLVLPLDVIWFSLARRFLI